MGELVFLLAINCATVHKFLFGAYQRIDTSTSLSHAPHYIIRVYWQLSCPPTIYRLTIQRIQRSNITHHSTLIAATLIPTHPLRPEAVPTPPHRC
jgi:hypothetical protein